MTTMRPHARRLHPTQWLNGGLSALLLAGGALWAGHAHAEDRALLIGVGKYRIESANLPGIDLDIGMMKEVAEGLGFKPSAIKVVMNEEATLEGVRSAFKQWLHSGIGPQDRVLIYYSGHGTQVPDENGDEEDGLDEALTMHDLGRVQRDGKVTLGGVLIDDEIAVLLSQIPSQQVLMLIDACHSGTATRSLALGSQRLGVADGTPKVFRDPLVAAARSAGLKPTSQEVKSDNYVAISAAADNEQSIATSRGSVFTLALREALIVKKDQGRISARELWKQATDFVAAKLQGPRLFHPQINGNMALADKPVLLADTSRGQGAAWRKIDEMVTGASGLVVKLDQAQYREGSKMRMEVAVDRPGYLNVVSIGPDDVPVVLFPNQHHPDNKVAVGNVKLPTPAMKFEFVAQKPYGATLVAAFLTDQPIDLYRSAEGERDAQGKMVDVLGRMSEASVRQMRAFRVQAAAPAASGAASGTAPGGGAGSGSGTAAAGYRAGSARAAICPATGACP